MNIEQMIPGHSGSVAWLTARPIAHRGLHDVSRGIIENSQSAFAGAIDHDYPIECDIQIARDGEAMVFHDPTLERLTGKSGPVNAQSASELGHIALKGSSECPQTLDQLLEQVNDRVPLIIELKSLWDGSERLAIRACEIIANYHGRAALMSFDPLIVETICKAAPQILRGGVSDLFEPSRWPELTSEQLAARKPGEALLQAHTHFMFYSVNTLTSPQAKRYRATGRPIICWTVRDADTAEQAMQLCDQITFEGFLA